MRIRAVAAVLAVSAATAGCAVSTVAGRGSALRTPTPSAPTTGSTSLPALTSTPPSTSPPPSPSTPAVTSSVNPGPARFGHTYTWPDGLSLTIAVPKRFRPSSDADTRPARAYLNFVMILTNHSRAVVRTSLFDAVLRAGGDDASQVIDFEHGYNFGPDPLRLPPGKTTRFHLGFGVNATTGLTMIVRPDLDHAATFTS